MIDTGAGLRVRRRMLLLLLLVCIALPLVGGCSSDPECIAVPFLPECFERRRRGGDGRHGDADPRQGERPRRRHRHHLVGFGGHGIIRSKEVHDRHGENMREVAGDGPHGEGCHGRLTGPSRILYPLTRAGARHGRFATGRLRPEGGRRVPEVPASRVTLVRGLMQRTAPCQGKDAACR